MAHSCPPLPLPTDPAPGSDEIRRHPPSLPSFIRGASHLAKLVDVVQRLEQGVHITGGALVLEPDIPRLLARVVGKVLGHAHLHLHLCRGISGAGEVSAPAGEVAQKSAGLHRRLMLKRSPMPRNIAAPTSTNACLPLGVAHGLEYDQIPSPHTPFLPSRRACLDTYRVVHEQASSRIHQVGQGHKGVEACVGGIEQGWPREVRGQPPGPKCLDNQEQGQVSTPFVNPASVAPPASPWG